MAWQNACSTTIRSAPSLNKHASWTGFLYRGISSGLKNPAMNEAKSSYCATGQGCRKVRSLANRSTTTCQGCCFPIFTIGRKMDPSVSASPVWNPPSHLKKAQQEKFSWGSLLLGEAHKSPSRLLTFSPQGVLEREKKHFSCCGDTRDRSISLWRQMLYR